MGVFRQENTKTWTRVGNDCLKHLTHYRCLGCFVQVATGLSLFFERPACALFPALGFSTKCSTSKFWLCCYVHCTWLSRLIKVTRLQAGHELHVSARLNESTCTPLFIRLAIFKNSSLQNSRFVHKSDLKGPAFIMYIPPMRSTYVRVYIRSAQLINILITLVIKCCQTFMISYIG